MDLAAEFPLDEDLIYLNHAAVGPWPQRTAQAIEAFTRENLHSAIRRYPIWVQAEDRLRKRLASLLGDVNPVTIAIQKNTSEALSTVAFGLDWQDGANVVLPASEFPSNSACWEALAARGVELRQVALDGDAPEDSLLAAFDRNTALLTVSSVAYTDGMALDLERLGAACRRQGILFCVDAIQSLGATAIDVDRCHVDFLAGGSHKWLLAPEGVGFLYCREELLQRVQPLARGWRMGETPFGFETPPWGPAHGGRRFEAGTLNTLGMIALDASLSLLEEIGYGSVERRVRERANVLLEAFEGLPGFELATPRDPARRLGIVSLRGDDVDAAFKRLKAARVLVAVRGGLLRFSPHFYTSTADLEAAATVLRSPTRA